MMKIETYGDFRFFVKNGCLKRVENIADGERDLVIPHFLPEAGEIKSIGEDLLYGIFNMVSIDDQISKIYPRAFMCASVDEVVWPAACDYIPAQCFSYSAIQNIKNIDHVISIDREAFSYSKLNNLDLSSSTIYTIGAEAFVGIDPEVISKPYYVSESEFKVAFEPQL